MLRPLLVVALLAAGNLFCTGCPFVLARDAGRRFLPPRLTLPRWLRTWELSALGPVGANLAAQVGLPGVEASAFGIGAWPTSTGITGILRPRADSSVWKRWRA